MKVKEVIEEINELEKDIKDLETTLNHEKDKEYIETLKNRIEHKNKMINYYKSLEIKDEV